MNRLRNEAGLDPISERGIEILRRTPATHSSPARKRRVWALLQRTTARGTRRRSFGGTGMLPGIPGILGPILVLAAVAVATTAAAAIGERWISSARERAARRPFAGPAGVVPRARGAAPRKIATGEPAPGLEARPPAATEPAARTARPALPHRVERPAPTAARSVVWGALVALRSDHDAPRAARLLDGYLAENRRGGLREEALALAVEAGDAEHDAARARLFAGAYLHEFPAGRFASFARRHLSGALDGTPIEEQSPLR
ncbi:MAG TPA: hypothetical protein VKZ18_13280 [Polyangia bacterium]|nr:hypothetical protein [Polyangia bacterium]